MADDMGNETPRWVKPAAIVGGAGAVVLGGAALLGGVGGKGPDQTQIPATPTPSEAAATPKTTDVIATPTDTFKVEISPTPEVKKEVPCQIVEQEYCDQLEAVHFKGFTVIVGNLPVGTQIFAPFDGQVATGKINQPSPYQGFTVSMSDHGVIYNFNGDFKPLTSTGKAGTPIATMTDTGAKNFNGAYNFEFEILKPNDAKTDLVSAEDIERKLFPTAFEKPIKEVSYTGGSATTTLIGFEGKP